MPYDIYTEFKINGTWTDYSDWVRGETGITIIRGTGDQQSALSPQTSSFTLNNRDGLFSNRNPNSPLFGLIPQNTPVRHRVGPNDSHLKIRHPLDGGVVSTSDKAALDITGDIDVRIELTPDSWRPPHGTALCGKVLLTGSQRSWALRLMSDGHLVFSWSVTGATTIAVESANSIPENSGRLALRATLDVVDGANKTVTFYTAPSISGPWTLFETQTSVGNTSIFASTAILEVGGVQSGSYVVDETGGYGKYHAFELRNGINGALVAQANFTTLSPGTTSWSDGLGNTWSVNGNARIGSDAYRFTGETTSLPVKWDKSGNDCYVPVTAAGVLRRLSQRSKPLHSPIFRNFIQYKTLSLYAPLEDESGSTTIGNFSTFPNRIEPDFQGVTFTGTQPIGLPGSSGSATLNNVGSYITFRAGYKANTGTAAFIIYFKFPALPAAAVKFLSLSSSGTGHTWEIGVGPNNFTFDVKDRDGVTLGNSNILFGAGASPLNQWVGMGILLTTEGGNTRWKTNWHAVGSETFYTHAVGGQTYAGSVGRFTMMVLQVQDTALQGAEFSQAMIAQENLEIVTNEFAEASNGYLNEPAGTRARRLCLEEGVQFDIYGEPGESELMGPQGADTLTNLLQECVLADDGLLFELRDELGFAMKTRVFIENNEPTELMYTDSPLAETPDIVEDDRYIINDVTATRPLGSSARFEVLEGPLSVQESPGGVGRYDGEIPLNVASDLQLYDQAAYRAFKGTWDEPRVPALVVGLHRPSVANNAALLGRIIATDIGDWMRLSDLPSYVPPGDLDLVITGMTETITRYEREITFPTIPAGPYKTPLLDSAENPVRLDAENSTLDVAISTTSATSIQVTNNGDAADTWVPASLYPGDMNFSIVINGEEMLVTNVSDIFSSTKQTLTVTRAMNGVPKTHAVGSLVRLARPFYVTL